MTKRQFFHKPNYATLEFSLQALKRHLKRLNIYELAIPKLGCGYDQLHWPTVFFPLIQSFFGLKPQNNNLSTYPIGFKRKMNFTIFQQFDLFIQFFEVKRSIIRNPSATKVAPPFSIPDHLSRLQNDLLGGSAIFAKKKQIINFIQKFYRLSSCFN